MSVCTFSSGFSGVATRSGTVAFSEGSTLLGTRIVSAGAASFSTSALAVGAHTISAAYSGDASFSAASATVAQSVSLATAQVVDALSPSAPSYGQPLTVSVTVAKTAPATATPGGTITILDGATVLGTVALDANGKGTFTIASLGAGPHSISIGYGGDATYGAASTAAATAISVGQAATAVALAPSPAAPVSGQAASFAITVTSPGGTPTGTVALDDGGTPLGTATLASGAATLAVPGGFLVGTHTLTARYAGSANFFSSSASPLALAMTRAATSLVLDASVNPLRVNRPVTFHALVAATAPGAGIPTGTVAFSDGAQPLGSVSLDASGAASLTVPSLPYGKHPITASYAGSTEFRSSGGALAGGENIEKSPPVAGSGSALSFDGKSQDVAIANAAGTLDAARAVELWFQPAAADAPGAPACLVQQGEGSAVRFGLCLTAARDGLEVRSGEARQAVPLALAAGWHHLALVDDGSAINLIVDGVQVASLAGSLPPGAAQPVLLAGAPSGTARTDFFAGSIDEVRLWSAAPSAASLASNRMRPVAGDQQDLLALWRLDEGAGTEAYDAASHHVVARLEGATPPAWIPSSAWKRRTTNQERPLDPFVAGYDPDGVPLTVMIATVASNGTAAVSGTGTSNGAGDASGLIEYMPAAKFLGTDSFTYAVSNGVASSEFATEVEMVHIDTCQALNDCAGGDVCVNQVCEAPAVLTSVSGGCSSVPGNGSSPALLALCLAAALALLRRRRRLVLAPASRSVAPDSATLARGRAGSRASRALSALSLLAVFLCATRARAAGFALDTYSPTPVGDRFFAVPDAAVSGSLSPTFGLQGGWAHQPLVLHSGGVAIANGSLVQDRMTLRLGAALSLLDRVLVDADISMSAWQHGQMPFSGQTAISASAFFDPRIGARMALLRSERLSVAAGLSLWLPLGSQQNFGSDATVRAMPELIASGRTGKIAYTSQLALDLRKHSDILFTQTGSGVRLGAAGGYLFLDDKLQVGPELYSRMQLSGPATSSLEALLGARLQRGDFTYGAGIGGRLVQDAPGAAPLRVVAEVTFNGFDLFRRSSRAVSPPARPAQLVVAPPPAPPPAPLEPAPAVAEAPVVLAQIAEPPPPAPPAAPAADPLAEPGRVELQSVQFGHDRAVLLPQSDAALEAAAATLRAHPELGSVLVAGYGDDHGPRAHNLKLTSARASAVRRWFIEHDIAAGRLHAVGCGSVEPVASNDTEEGRVKNRRVELRIPAGDGKQPGCTR